MYSEKFGFGPGGFYYEGYLYKSEEGIITAVINIVNHLYFYIVVMAVIAICIICIFICIPDAYERLMFPIIEAAAWSRIC